MNIFYEKFQVITQIFTGIFLEALPFILLGSFIAVIISRYMNEERIRKITPNNKILGGMVVGLIGIVFPICECITVPITKELIKKGVPINIAITFMLAVPIVNPIAILSTYYAFDGKLNMILLRVLIGYALAVIIGIIMSFNKIDEVIIDDNFNNYKCDCGCMDCKVEVGVGGFLHQVGKEFYEIGKIFIIGSLLTTIMQCFIPREIINNFSNNKVLAVISMLVLTYVLALCSEADAFVASSFVGTFPTGAIVGFLLLGPMLDLKNNVMLFSMFKKKFVFKLMFWVIGLCFAVGLIIP